MRDIFKKSSKSLLTSLKKDIIMQNVVSRARYVLMSKMLYNLYILSGGKYNVNIYGKSPER